MIELRVVLVKLALSIILFSKLEFEVGDGVSDSGKQVVPLKQKPLLA